MGKKEWNVDIYPYTNFAVLLFLCPCHLVRNKTVTTISVDFRKDRKNTRN